MREGAARTVVRVELGSRVGAVGEPSELSIPALLSTFFQSTNASSLLMLLFAVTHAGVRRWGFLVSHAQR